MLKGVGIYAFLVNNQLPLTYKCAEQGASAFKFPVITRREEIQDCFKNLKVTISAGSSLIGAFFLLLDVFFFNQRP